MKIKCNCGNEIELKHSDTSNLDYYYCKNCEIGGKGKNEPEAKKIFFDNINESKNNPVDSLIIQPPKDKISLPSWTTKNLPAILEQSARFINKPATTRMITKNVKYAMSADLKKCWGTEKGRDSIANSLMESFYIGATMPEMGCLVPYGETVEFIPDVSAYEFALTAGSNAPFEKITIEALFSNDKYEGPKRGEDGEFFFNITKMGFPRGDVIGIVVQAIETDSGLRIGEAFDEKRLMEKAERHSKSYRYYLDDIAALKKAKTENKNFIIKWEKKIFEKDIKNPYVGPDKPEMLRKLAGKSFFGKWIKTRNARSMKNEWQEDKSIDSETREEMIDRTLDESLEQLGNVVDADYVETNEDENLFQDEEK